MAEAAGGVRWRPGPPARYFRLPRPAAVSTLAALTSPAPAAGGEEEGEELPGLAGGRGRAAEGVAARRGAGPRAGRGPLGFRTWPSPGVLGGGRGGWMVELLRNDRLHRQAAIIELGVY